jgi:prepilin-type processing-associated H-X9-DG protein
MTKTTLPILALSILLELCSPLCKADTTTLPLADRIPDDAILYIGWTGSTSLGPSYDNSHLKAILDSSALPQLFNESLPRLFESISQKEPDAKPVLQLVTAIGGPLWRHPSALYFGGIDFVGNMPLPRVALLCDAGDEAGPLLSRLNDIIGQIPPGPLQIFARQYGSLVVLSVGDPAKTDSLFSKPLDTALSKSAKFTAAQVQVQHDASAVIYLDFQGTEKLIDATIQRIHDPHTTAMWPKIRDTLNLTGLRQAIWTTGFDGQDWSDQSFVNSDGSTTGIPGLLHAPPLDDDLLAQVPQTANRVVAGQFDIGGLVRAIRSAIAQMDPATAQQVDQFSATANAMIGLDIQKDFLDPLGTQWVMYTDRSIGGPGFLGTVVINKLKDPAKEDAALTEIAGRANFFISQGLAESGTIIDFRQTTVDGSTIHYLAVPLVSPAWTIKDGNLYLGLYPQVVASALTSAKAKGPSILQNPQYIALQHRLGDHKPAAISYFDLPSMAGDGYEDLLVVSRLYLGIADLFGAQVPAMVLPPLDKVLAHLGPSESIEWSDDTGLHARGISSFPGSDALAGSSLGPATVGEAALLTSILLPSLNRSRETANRVKCASNERQIGQAILLYCNDNRGKYPPDLGTLVKTEDITPEVFVCPSGNTQVPPGLTGDKAVAWVNEHSDYIYVGKGLTISGPPDRIVLYEKLTDHGHDGVNMLYGDGHVEFQSMPQAQQMINQLQQNIPAGPTGEHGL